MRGEFEKEATIVLYECENLQRDMEEMRKILAEIAKIAQVKIVASCEYQHEGGAKSMSAIVEESFISLDEWREYGTVIVRVASCNPNSNFKEVEKYAKERFGCKEARYYEREIPLYLTK